MAQRHEYENQKQVICEWAYAAIYGFFVEFLCCEKCCELYSKDSKLTTHLYVGSIIEDQLHSELRLVGRV